MDAALAGLTLLGLVTLSGLFVRVRGMPLPLVQIGLGAIVASLPFGPRIELNPSVFMLLFVPPLLFSDGWRISKREFAEHRRPILMLALGLVLLTTVGGGYAIHWLLPSLPLAAAIVLAAALSPTDAVAVSALTGRALPSPLAPILEGETLINDASGLTACKFAVAAAAGSSLTPTQAVWDLAWTGIGGVAVGVAASILFRRIQSAVTLRCGASAETANLLLLIMPYAAYLLAEHIGCSGILAVATAGLVAGRMTTIREGRPVDRLLGTDLWGMLSMVLSGIVFVLVGQQLPGMMDEVASAADGRSPVLLAAEAVGVFLILLTMRVGWIWTTLGVASLRNPNGLLARLPRSRATIAASLAGVRGPITLAAVLALPVSTPDGSTFAARNVVIVLALGVILLSLVVAAIVLPVLAQRMPAHLAPNEALEEQEAEIALATAAIQAAEKVCARALRNAGDDALHAAAKHVMAACRRRIAMGHGSQEIRATACHAAEAERSVRLTTLQAEREELYRLRALQRIGDPVLHNLLRQIDLAEVALLDAARQRS
ncbi:Na+/H+ antiporter [Paracraurococcus lichenis]|uniref:Na+/H+ antiporter n=1 Tax=Paracraurococcus lichenis TaxID=3064888 RepID=A0ABT9ECV9_9PROT|nr:Na+/H+ antiporter [Paracraurococcus sp. LOR1-02]MDO9714048.1 Na+/H+ antiporter [Paracraurococcus sp. LOR1-02]